MKIFISMLITITVICMTVSLVFADTPKFKVHILKNLAPGVNYSINTPVVFDYDGDGDLDVLLITKEGVMFFLENLQIP